MFNRIRAFVIVIIASYLPCVLLWAVETMSKSYYLFVLPGWFLSLFAHGNKEVQFWLAAIGTLGVLAGLTWLGAKGRRQLGTAATLAFLNSAVCAGLTWIAIGIAGATGGAG
jgi:hypothetical protein